MNPSRTDALNNLVNFSLKIELIRLQLARFPWDSPEPLVRLTRSHMAACLARYIAGDISNIDVAQWADLIEGREDIEIKSDDRDVLSELLFQLANPDLAPPLSPSSAQIWLNVLDPNN